ncbi:MAG: hypothetical protein H6641_19910 [Caldilineaceae bacterium]|nr:hypothetical protein [Caldilineaceae bacterium]
MLNPYLLMVLLYLFVAILAALDASFASFSIAPWFNGIRWLRIHFITLGMVTETLFGVLPILVANRLGRERPKIRWDIWVTLNVGLVVLLAGIPSVNGTLILTGGTLIFIAATLLAVQLWQMRSHEMQADEVHSSQSAKFYVSGLAYLLLGITVGTGLWLGWSGPLRIQVPLEVHIHANNWGFLSLVFSGLLIDVIPRLSGRPLMESRTIRMIFWSMTLGALGLVIGPWLGGSLWFTVPGLVLHLSATIALLIITARALAHARQFRVAGGWHLIMAYTWILLPVLVAPLIILGVPGFPGMGIEATAPQALIYGWVLQIGYALIPYLASRYIADEAKPQLGGNWLSLVTVNIGSALVWASIFILAWQNILHGTAYVFYVVSMIPVVIQLGQIMHGWFNEMEQRTLAAAGD